MDFDWKDEILLVNLSDAIFSAFDYAVKAALIRRLSKIQESVFASCQYTRRDAATDTNETPI